MEFQNSQIGYEFLKGTVPALVDNVKEQTKALVRLTEAVNRLSDKFEKPEVAVHAADDAKPAEPENELMILVGDNNWSWIYFKTSQTSARAAFAEFYQAAEKVGINVDNLNAKMITLRDKNAENIGEFVLR